MLRSLKDYRIIAIIWLAVGVAVTSYFYISPPSETIRYKVKNPMYESQVRYKESLKAYDDFFITKSSDYNITEKKYINRSYYDENLKLYKYSLVITVIGLLLICGIGYILNNNFKKRYK